MARTFSSRHTFVSRAKALFIAAALMLATLAGYAAPSVQVETAKSHCHTLDMVDWWVVTGQISEYGGTLCH
jgi:hypothetical protein